MRNGMEHRMVFVGGLHRSGTSILFKCLRDHPEISGFVGTGVPEDEGQHLQSVYPPATVYGGGGRFGFNPEAHLTEASPLVNEENRRKLFSEWSTHWDMSRKYLLEKSPPNLIRTRFLQSMFPDSRFVIIVRHPLAYAYPRNDETGIWNVYSRVKHWLVCHELLRADSAHLHNAIILKYEEFVLDPAGHLERIFSFLGLPNHPSAQTVRQNINAKYIGRWKASGKGFPRNLVARMISGSFEQRVRSFGYSIRNPETVEPWNSVVEKQGS